MTDDYFGWGTDFDESDNYPQEDYSQQQQQQQQQQQPNKKTPVQSKHEHGHFEFNDSVDPNENLYENVGGPQTEPEPGPGPGPKTAKHPVNQNYQHLKSVRRHKEEAGIYATLAETF